MPHEAAVRIIAEGSGSQFDPAIVAAFLRNQQVFPRIVAICFHRSTSVFLEQPFRDRLTAFMLRRHPRPDGEGATVPNARAGVRRWNAGH
jgi:hypothetical protein